MPMCCEESCIRTLLSDLMEVLHKEIDQYRNLMDLLQVQREYLSVYDIDSSAEMSKRQETVILSIKMLEEGRKAVVSRIAQYLDVPLEQISLTELSTLTDKSCERRCPVCQRKMLPHQREIISLIDGLESLRLVNAILIQQELRSTNQVLRIFASPKSKSAA
jgi:flagellar biosynthesis/type III secretory pathway chaperone